MCDMCPSSMKGETGGRDRREGGGETAQPEEPEGEDGEEEEEGEEGEEGGEWYCDSKARLVIVFSRKTSGSW